MKPALHSLLPPIFRFVEQIGLSLPRRDYKQASEYTKVPVLADDTLPRLQEIPALIHNISRRTRSDSVGPQSAADAYETLAYREKKRRESMDSTGRRPAMHKRGTSTEGVGTGVSKYEQEMGTGRVVNMEGQVVGLQNVEVVEGHELGELGEGGADAEAEAEERREEAEMFMRIERPRVRYDVEVITKLFVYSGGSYPVYFELGGNY